MHGRNLSKQCLHHCTFLLCFHSCLFGHLDANYFPVFFICSFNFPNPFSREIFWPKLNLGYLFCCQGVDKQTLPLLLVSKVMLVQNQPNGFVAGPKSYLVNILHTKE